MCADAPLCFVTSADAEVALEAWGRHEWLARPGLGAVGAMRLVRVTMPPGRAHAFHRHPGFAELLYVLSGRAEQWVRGTQRVIGPGDVVHVPKDAVHGTYNVFAEPITFLAMLAPGAFEGPATIDVSEDEPWRSLRGVR